MTGREVAPLLLLLGAFGFVLFFRIGDAPVANHAEQRVEAVVREMVASGDWLVPRIDGQPRLHKPPGYYWVSAALSSLAGEATWTSVRAGSAIAALLLVGVIFAWGRAIGGPALGSMAALCLSAMHFMPAFGRRGVAEMMLALFSTLALASFDRIHFEQRRGWLPLFAAAFAGAILAKATTALLLVGLPIGLWLAVDGSWRSRAGRDVLAASALAVVAGFLWYGVVFATVPGAAQVVFSEALLPLGVQVEGTQSALHYASPTKYLGPLLTGTLPAALLLPLAIKRGVQSRLHAAAPRQRFVALGLLSLLLGLALIPQKQRHYLLPLLPLLALLLAEAVLELQSRAPERLRAGALWLSALVTPLGLSALAVVACFYGSFLGVPPALSIGLPVAAVALLAALLWAAQRGRMRAFATLSAVCTFSFMLVWFGSINIWQRQREAGTAAARLDYEPARWQRASEAHPLIARYLLSSAPES